MAWWLLQKPLPKLPLKDDREVEDFRKRTESWRRRNVSTGEGGDRGEENVRAKEQPETGRKADLRKWRGQPGKTQLSKLPFQDVVSWCEHDGGNREEKHYSCLSKRRKIRTVRNA